MLILCSPKYCSNLFVQRGNREGNTILEYSTYLSTSWIHTETWGNYLLQAGRRLQVCPSLTCCWCLEGVTLMRQSLHSFLSWQFNKLSLCWNLGPELTLNHWIIITELWEEMVASGTNTQTWVNILLFHINPSCGTNYKFPPSQFLPF